MHITELPVEAELKVQVYALNSDVIAIEFKTVVKEIQDATILVEAITNDNQQPISFSSNKVALKVEYIDNSNNANVPILWEDVFIKYVKKGKNGFHQIIQTKDGRTVNRRQAFRLYIGEDATLHITTTTEAMQVILKDISSTGFGFVTEKDIDINKTRMCVLQSNIDGKRIKLNGTIVRKKEIEGTEKFVYGCQLPKFALNLIRLYQLNKEKNYNKRDHDNLI